MIYLVDIDGTIASLSHRLHYIQQKPADWDSFFGACGEDKPIREVIWTVQDLSESGAKIYLVTGRSDAVRNQTERWLSEHKVPWNALYMRKAGDHRQDDIVKSELLDAILQETEHDIIVAAFEDRDQVVNMYRARGIKTYQVAPGGF